MVRAGGGVGGRLGVAGMRGVGSGGEGGTGLGAVRLVGRACGILQLGWDVCGSGGVLVCSRYRHGVVMDERSSVVRGANEGRMRNAGLDLCC